MSFDAVGTVINKARAAGMRVRFKDGAVARVDPVEQVYKVSRAGKKTCQLNSDEGRPYLAAMCHDAEVIDAFHQRWGKEPQEMLGYSPGHLPKAKSPAKDSEDLPKVESIHIDVYV